MIVQPLSGNIETRYYYLNLLSYEHSRTRAPAFRVFLFLILFFLHSKHWSFGRCYTTFVLFPFSFPLCLASHIHDHAINVDFWSSLYMFVGKFMCPTVDVYAYIFKCCYSACVSLGVATSSKIHAKPRMDVENSICAWFLGFRYCKCACAFQDHDSSYNWSDFRALYSEDRKSVV